MGILEVKGITKEFDGVKALKGVSFSIKRGAITALIGPNGAGKTTILNILSGFLNPDEGEIFFKDKKITGCPPFKIAKMGITRTFQNTKLFLQITVLENILLAMRYKNGENLKDVILRRRKVLKEERLKIKKAMEYLKLVGLINKSGELAENLSYGQRKLLELAKALATEAELFLLDEPFAGVFLETRKEIINLMQRMKSEGKTIVFIEHIVGIVSDISDRIIVLRHGEKIAEGEFLEILKDKKVIDSYLGGEFDS